MFEKIRQMNFIGILMPDLSDLFLKIILLCQQQQPAQLPQVQLDFLPLLF
jgi:hypothetical protein